MPPSLLPSALLSKPSYKLPVLVMSLSPCLSADICPNFAACVNKNNSLQVAHCTNTLRLPSLCQLNAGTGAERSALCSFCLHAQGPLSGDHMHGPYILECFVRNASQKSVSQMCSALVTELCVNLQQLSAFEANIQHCLLGVYSQCSHDLNG